MSANDYQFYRDKIMSANDYQYKYQDLFKALAKAVGSNPNNPFNPITLSILALLYSGKISAEKVHNKRLDENKYIEQMMQLAQEKEEKKEEKREEKRAEEEKHERKSKERKEERKEERDDYIKYRDMKFALDKERDDPRNIALKYAYAKAFSNIDQADAEKLIANPQKSDLGFHDVSLYERLLKKATLGLYTPKSYTIV